MCISWCAGGGEETMTWTLVLVLSAIAYTCKVTGLVIIGGRELLPPVEFVAVTATAATVGDYLT